MTDDEARAGIAAVLRRADEALVTARYGLADLSSQLPDRRFAGLRSVVVFGRSVTNILANIRTYDRAHFNAWWTPIATEMKSDPLLRFVYTLRSVVLKEGRLDIDRHFLAIRRVDMSAMDRLVWPEGATRFFVGGDRGGVGWEFEAPDGSVTRQYIEHSGVSFETRHYFADAPTEHLGESVPGLAAEDVCARYLDYLSALLDNARDEFVSP